MSTDITDNSSRKRRRTSESEPVQPATQELIQDKVVWYDDGNIVVRAGPGCTGEGPIYGFKCHRSVLSGRSKVFETMLQLPNGGDRAVDGVPVVDFPDPWEDVRDFVRMMYGGLELPPYRRSWRSATQIAGALRLAIKYDVADMARHLLNFLKRDWPSDYLSWVEIEKETMLAAEHMARETYAMGADFFYDINSHTPEPAFVVKLVQDVHAGHALRAAWYELARSYGQGSTPFRDFQPGPPDVVTRRSADLSLLSADDLRRLVVGRERLNDMVASVVDGLQRCKVFFAPTNADEHHKQHSTCIGGAQEIFKRYTSGLNFWETAQDPLGSFIRMQTDVRRSSTVCTSCKTDVCDELVDASCGIWNALADIFDLKTFGLELDPPLV